MAQRTKIPWRQYAVIPLAGAILATGMAVGQFRLAARDDGMKEIANELTIKAVEEHNSDGSVDARERQSERVREAVGSAHRAEANVVDHRARGQRLALCAAFLLGLAIWLWLKGRGPQRR